MATEDVVHTTSGATLGICAALPDTYDQAGYESTDLIFVLIGNIENYGNHGVTAAITEFTPVDTAVVAKMKGSKNYGTMSMMVGNVESDVGLAVLDAAAESNNHYSAKLTYPSGEVHYLDVLVAKAEYIDGSVNDARKRGVDLAICRKPIIVPVP